MGSLMVADMDIRRQLESDEEWLREVAEWTPSIFGGQLSPCDQRETIIAEGNLLSKLDGETFIPRRITLERVIAMVRGRYIVEGSSTSSS